MAPSGTTRESGFRLGQRPKTKPQPWLAWGRLRCESSACQGKSPDALLLAEGRGRLSACQLPDNRRDEAVVMSDDRARGADEGIADKSTEITETERREALGRLAKYTAPAMLAMLASNANAQVCVSPCG